MADTMQLMTLIEILAGCDSPANSTTQDELVDPASELIEAEFYDYFMEDSAQNSTFTADFLLNHRTVIITIQAILLGFCLTGNCLIVATTRVSKGNQTPTYNYLVSIWNISFPFN